MVDLGIIPVFVAVVEEGGFSKAAEALGITKSAVSKRITALEAQLGVRLIQRTTRRLSLTEAGERYFRHAVEALDAARRAESAATELQEIPQGCLRIRVPMSFGRLHIAPLVPAFLQRYPKIEVDLVMDDKAVNAVETAFDVSLSIGMLPDSSLIARRLAPCHSVVCASPEYLQRQGEPRRPKALIEHNCIQYSYSAEAREWTFQGGGRSETIEVSGNYRVNNGEALREALVRGIGIGRCPIFIAGPDLASGRLVRLLEGYSMPSKTLYALYPRCQYLPEKVRVFLDFAVEYLGGDAPYWDRLA